MLSQPQYHTERVLPSNKSSLVLLRYIFLLSELMAAGDATYLVKMLHCHWFVKSNILSYAKCEQTLSLCYILLVLNLDSINNNYM